MRERTPPWRGRVEPVKRRYGEREERGTARNLAEGVNPKGSALVLFDSRSALDNERLGEGGYDEAAVRPIRNGRYAVLRTYLAREVETQSRMGRS